MTTISNHVHYFIQEGNKSGQIPKQDSSVFVSKIKSSSWISDIYSHFSNGMYFITIYYILKSVRVLELLYLTIKIIFHYPLFVCTDFEFNIISFMKRLQIVRGKLKTRRWYDTRGRETQTRQRHFRERETQLRVV